MENVRIIRHKGSKYWNVETKIFGIWFKKYRFTVQYGDFRNYEQALYFYNMEILENEQKNAVAALPEKIIYPPFPDKEPE